MNLSHQLTRRFTALNRGAVGLVEPVQVKPDGHGTYLIDADKGRRHIVQQVYVSPLAARKISHGQNNPNLDSHLRL